MINIDIMSMMTRKGVSSHTWTTSNQRILDMSLDSSDFSDCIFIAAPWTELHTGSVFRRISDVYIVCLNGARPTKNACFYSSKTITDYDSRGINLGSVSKNHRFVYCRWYLPCIKHSWLEWFSRGGRLRQPVDRCNNVCLASTGFVESWESKDAHP